MGEWMLRQGLGLLLFGTSGALLLGWSVSILRQAHATRHWPQAPGEIVAVRRVTRWVSGESGRDAIQRVHVTYRYEVAGRQFQGRRVRVGPLAMASMAATLRRYRKGQACRIPLKRTRARHVTFAAFAETAIKRDFQAHPSIPNGDLPCQPPFRSAQSGHSSSSCRTA